MYQVSPEQFEELVAAGLKAIPSEFQKEIKNVVVTIEDYPTREQLIKLELRPGHHTLFGLYEGVSLNKRAGNYAGVLPDKITLFQGPIQWASNTEEDLNRIVTNTIWHEFAHYFGMDEAQVRAAERKRGMYY